MTDCVIQQQKAKILYFNAKAVLGLTVSFYCLFSFIMFFSKVILEHFSKRLVSSHQLFIQSVVQIQLFSFHRFGCNMDQWCRGLTVSL